MENAKLTRIWENVRKFWDYPRVNAPALLDPAAARRYGLQYEIAAIRMDTNHIMVNEENLRKRVGIGQLGRILSHEVGHHKYIPYDLKNFVRLVGHADKVLQNMEHARLIQNLYADLCVNTKAYQKGDQGMIGLYQHLSHGNDAELWQVYMATYEYLTNTSGKIIPQPRQKIQKTARKLADIVAASMDQASKWPQAIEDFAQLMKEYMDKKAQEQMRQGMIDYQGAKDFLPYDTRKTPRAVQAKQLEKELKGLARELGEHEFRRLITGLRLGTRKQADLWLYRDLARKYTMEMPLVEGNGAGDYKETPVRWTMDEPFDQLDVEYSLRQSPLLIPNVTTYKWHYENGSAASQGSTTPDLSDPYSHSPQSRDRPNIGGGIRGIACGDPISLCRDQSRRESGAVRSWESVNVDGEAGACDGNGRTTNERTQKSRIDGL